MLLKYRQEKIGWFIVTDTKASNEHKWMGSSDEGNQKKYY